MEFKTSFIKSVRYLAVSAAVLLLPVRANATTYEYQLSNSLNCGGGSLYCGAGMTVADLNGFEAKFAFNFNAPDADMKLIFDSVANTIRIVGSAYSYLYESDDGWNPTSAVLGGGYYDFDITYRANVSSSAAGLEVTASSALNAGTLEKASGLLDGYTFLFSDKYNSDAGYSFFFGPGGSLSVGSGWFMLAGYPYSGRGDWNFAGKLIGTGGGGGGGGCSGGGCPVPEPATMFLLGSGLMGAVAFRRRPLQS